MRSKTSNFDLRNATKGQRIEWRRSFTINWLYDLVNVYSSIVVQRDKSGEQCFNIDNLDWPVDKPREHQRILFGLSEFAGWITKLAFQDAKTDIRPQVLPHHVFQLQCIIDSLMVSRGWSINSLEGHVLEPAPQKFCTLRDVDLFLDREDRRVCQGFIHGVSQLSSYIANDAIEYDKRFGNCNILNELKAVQKHFVGWLGNSNHMLDARKSTPSRFSSSSSNGLWEYSPYPCGVGLVEALDLSYRLSMLVLDRVPEVMFIIHLHNMLVSKGFITQPVALWLLLAKMFPHALFRDGKLPTENFKQAFLAHYGATGSLSNLMNRKGKARDIRDMFDVDANRFFNEKSTLLTYRKAD